MKSTDGVPLRGVSVYLFSSTGAHKERLTFWETGNHRRSPSGVSFGYGPQPTACVYLDGGKKRERRDTIVYERGGGIGSAEISQRVKPLKCIYL